MSLRRLESFLDERIGGGDFPGAVFAVDGPGGLIASGARGLRALEPQPEAVTEDSIYDLASLTKPLATAALATILEREGALSSADEAGRWIRELKGTDKEAVTVRQLAVHGSGLPAWLPLYALGEGIGGYIKAIAGTPPECPPGTRAIYSCPGYILLGEIVSRAGGQPLDALFERLIARPLALSTLMFKPAPALLPWTAPTEKDCVTERSMVRQLGLSYHGWRSGVLRGDVHDGNASGLGGVAGNAGLFGAASDLVALGRELLGRGQGLFQPREVLRFATLDAARARGEASAWALRARRHPVDEAGGPEPREGREDLRSFGWQMAASPGSAAEGVLPPAAFGHTGFTGTSMWLDPEAGRSYVLLTNRIHPSDRGTDMNAIRREFHRLAARLA